MLRVALVITELNVGGAERQLVQLATGLDRRFFKPHIFALGNPPEPPGDELVRLACDAEVKVEFLGASRWWQFGPTVSRLADRLREFAPAVMQSFLFHANVVGSLAARQARVPYVSLGIRVNDPSWWRSKLERRIAKHADRVVCVSEAVAQAASRRLSLRPDQCIVIPNGVDFDRIAQADAADLTLLGVPAGARPLIFVGRLTAQKGVERLLQLVPTLERMQTHLLIVGEGPERTRIQQAVPRLSSTRIHFAGWQQNVPSLLKACSSLLLPSQYEGMPNALLEAMAAGLPVLATPVEGVREILGDDPLQVRPFTAEAWTEALRTIADPTVANAIGERNQQQVVSRFSIASMASAYERLFSGLAGSHRPN